MNKNEQERLDDTHQRMRELQNAIDESAGIINWCAGARTTVRVAITRAEQSGAMTATLSKRVVYDALIAMVKQARADLKALKMPR